MAVVVAHGLTRWAMDGPVVVAGHMIVLIMCRYRVRRVKLHPQDNRTAIVAGSGVVEYVLAECTPSSTLQIKVARGEICIVLMFLGRGPHVTRALCRW